MKKLLFLSLAVLLTVVSCRKDKKSSDDSTDTQVTVTGTWVAEKFVINGTLTPSSVPVPVPFNQESTSDCVKESRLVLNEDGSGDLLLKFDPQIPGVPDLGCLTVVEQTSNYTYNEDENKLEFSAGVAGDQAVTVDDLTANTLVLKKGFEDFNYEGMGSFTGTVKVEFKK
ncbi:MAG: hypothetical protein CSA38_03390 [Flavobacteriales bacterium]|nr:MAG: hypothetical protein CSA38_03390 [Flavobacteriales bacterium]